MGDRLVIRAAPPPPRPIPCRLTTLIFQHLAEQPGIHVGVRVSKEPQVSLDLPLVRCRCVEVKLSVFTASRGSQESLQLAALVLELLGLLQQLGFVRLALLNILHLRAALASRLLQQLPFCRERALAFAELSLQRLGFVHQVLARSLLFFS